MSKTIKTNATGPYTVKVVENEGAYNQGYAVVLENVSQGRALKCRQQLNKQGRRCLVLNAGTLVY